MRDKKLPQNKENSNSLPGFDYENRVFRPLLSLGFLLFLYFSITEWVDSYALLAFTPVLFIITVLLTVQFSYTWAINQSLKLRDWEENSPFIKLFRSSILRISVSFIVGLVTSFSIIVVFLHASFVDWIICFLGVVIFWCYFNYAVIFREKHRIVFLRKTRATPKLFFIVCAGILSIFSVAVQFHEYRDAVPMFEEEALKRFSEILEGTSDHAILNEIQIFKAQYDFILEITYTYLTKVNSFFTFIVFLLSSLGNLYIFVILLQLVSFFSIPKNQVIRFTRVASMGEVERATNADVGNFFFWLFPIFMFVVIPLFFVSNETLRTMEGAKPSAYFHDKKVLLIEVLLPKKKEVVEQSSLKAEGTTDMNLGDSSKFSQIFPKQQQKNFILPESQELKTPCEIIDGEYFSEGTARQIQGLYAPYWIERLNNYEVDRKKITEVLDTITDEMENKVIEPFLDSVYTLKFEYTLIFKYLKDGEEQATEYFNNMFLNMAKDVGTELDNQLNVALNGSKDKILREKYEEELRILKNKNLIRESECDRTDTKTIVGGNLIGENFEPLATKFKNRFMVSSGSGALATGTLFMTKMSSKLATKGTLKFVTKALKKMVLKKITTKTVGTAITTAVGGFVGSIIPFAGTAAGAAAGAAAGGLFFGLSVDKIMVEVEEYLNRDELKRKLMLNVSEIAGELKEF